jgi:hypothetical protein
VLAHDDVAARRYALATAHLHDAIPLLVTIFDHTVADQLATLLPQCEVTSAADLAAPALPGPCIEQGLLAASRSGAGSRRSACSRPRYTAGAAHSEDGGGASGCRT